MGQPFFEPLIECMNTDEPEWDRRRSQTKTHDAPSTLRRLGALPRGHAHYLRFAELQDELVGVPANRCIEHFSRTGVRRVGQNRTLGVELESRSFNLSAH